MNAGKWTVRWALPLLFGAAASLPLAATAADGKVTLQNTAFNPPTVTIGVGEKVAWTNRDDVEHTVTSSGAESFDSNPNCPGALGVLRDCMTKGETFEHTFDQPGEFGYTCKLHPSMTGTVVVEAAEVTTTTVATTATTQAPTTSTTAATTTTTTRKLATSSTLPSSTTSSTTVSESSSTTVATFEAPAFDPGDGDGDGDGGTAAPASSDGGGSGTVALIVAALLAVAGGGGVLLWRLRPRAGGPPAA